MILSCIIRQVLYNFCPRRRKEKKLKTLTVVSVCQFWRWMIRHSSTAESQVAFLNLHKPHRYQPLHTEQCPCFWSLQHRVTTPITTSPSQEKEFPDVQMGTARFQLMSIASCPVHWAPLKTCTPSVYLFTLGTFFRLHNPLWAFFSAWSYFKTFWFHT